ncbi:RNA recognition domain-containing protein [Colletotrichum sublineola]|uniref:Putative RNA recognition domain-containing protein n=1 Tax=Colletotrichum sublineola TaxID=1173701 RepID=A0A066XNS6_COLSU|nr:RNA recognition domain-containing protein [Colletotrichum sublineola]KDN70577.1 putative RNA recognition domain-containing protein [Colletotrichum sublineola]
MFLAAEDTPLLRAWLMNKLPEVSDTETDILADYVLALLASQEGDAAHIRAACESELPQFLNTDAAPDFVEELFDVIEYKSYLPGAPPPPKKRSKPSFSTPVASSDVVLQSGSRKRSYHERGDASVSGERDLAFGDERAYKQPRRGQSNSRVSGPRGLGSPNGYHRQPPYAFDGPQQLPPATAPYDPNFPQPPAGLQDWHGLSQMPAYSQGAPYGPPHGPRRSRQKCRDFATKGYCARGNSCQYDHGIEPVWLPPGGPGGPPKFEDFDPRDAAMMMSQNFQQMQQLMEALNAERGGRDGRKNRRGAKGRRRQNRASFSAEGPLDDRTKTTIVVENIPEEYFSEEEVRKFFSEFGNIEQVTMQPYKRLATVKYDTWDAANAAYRSPKVIFDNRFVRVFWFVDESDQAAARAANASEDQEPEIDLEEFMKKQEEAQRQHEEKMQKKAELDKQRQELEQRQRELLAQHREVQQKLQAKLASKNGDAENAEGDSLNSALRAQLAALEDEAKLLGLDPSATDEPATWHSSTLGRGRGRGGFAPRGRGFAPRGRGSYRGGYRGDVHAAYAAYSLDNRPKTVSVTGVDFTSPEKDEVLRQYLLGVGEFTDIRTTAFETEVTFKDRKTAEKFYYGLPKQEIPGIDGQLELSWVSRSLPPVKITENAVSKRQDAPDHDMTMSNGAPKESSASALDQQPEEQPEMDYDVADDDDWGVE